jgi:hypothetical protein
MNTYSTSTAIAVALLALMSVTTVSAEKILLRDFETGLGEWASGLSHASGGERVEVDSGGGLRMYVPPDGNHVRYVPTVDGVVRYSIIEDGRPIEVRVDILAHTFGAGSVYLLLRFDDQDESGKFYIFGISYDARPMLWDFRDEASVANQNVQLSLIATAAGPNLILNTRILDLDNGGAVLFERTVVDTPEPDVLLAPWANSAAPAEPYFGNHDTRILLDTFSDNSNEAAEVLIDNFCVIAHDTPLLAMERAVRITFPATDRSFDLLSAPSVDGPWEIVQSPSFLDNGFIHFFVPASAYKEAEFFELSENPGF